MRKIILLFILVVLTFGMVSCKEESKAQKQLVITEMRNIAQLSTAKYIFHNVVKSEEPTGKAWFEFWKNDDIRFWMEYDSIVEVSLDVDKIQMSVDGEKVHITLPSTINVDVYVDPKSLTEESYYFDKNSDEPDNFDQTNAVDEAQKAILEKVLNNEDVKEFTVNNAKELIGNYVEKVGESLGIDYTIIWH